MKEQIHTIPVNEAFSSGDECPFCHLEREVEQRVINYVLGPGASYMEPDVRGATDEEGFCGAHLQKMYDYGNYLGSALILQTYYIGLLEELEQQLDDFELPEKKKRFHRKSTEVSESSLVQWMRKKQDSCFICNKMEYNMARYYHTFFVLLKDGEFRAKVESCKGFCMRHFLRLMEEAPRKLSNDRREWYYETVFSLMRENLSRVKGDLDWFIAKFDYRNASAPWKNSQDAVSRTMQKLQGLHPSDRPLSNR